MYMKIGIYSPYLDTLGGGERYLLTFVEYCLQRGWQVDLFWPDFNIISKAKDRFNLKLDGCKLNDKAYKRFSTSSSYFDKIVNYFFLKKYDLIFYLSDGSIPYLNAKQNWLHFQIPMNLDGKGFWTQKKLSKINRIICNSHFTKSFIDKSFSVDSTVVYPPVSVHNFINTDIKKENIILNVGRFDQVFESKRQDILIRNFKKMVDNGLEGWQLVFVGSNSHNETDLLKLRELGVGYPINFEVNVSYSELLSWYHRSSIYWHGAGFEIDEQNHPDKTEHFGMTIVEAMASKCITIAYNKGGVSEIIQDKINGYLWENETQLREMTKNMINSLGKEEKTVHNGVERAMLFSKEIFFAELEKLFK